MGWKDTDVWGAASNPQYNIAPAPGSIYNPQTNLPYQNTTGTNIQNTTGTNAYTPKTSGVGGNIAAGGSPATASRSNWEFLPTTGADGSSNPGYLGLGVGLAKTGIDAYLGFQGLGMARESLDFQKDSWERRFAMQQDQYYRKLNARRSINAVRSRKNCK